MTVWHQAGGGPALVAIEVEGQWIRDDFGRTETDSWGSADTGQAWTVTGGAADDYLVNGSVGAHLLDSVNVARNSVVGSNLRDVDITIGQIFDGVVPTGAPIQVGLLARWVDANNYLYARLFLLDDDSVLINLAAVVGGSETISSLVAVTNVTASSTYLAMRFQVEGSSLRARVWDNTTVEPSQWQAEMDHTGLDYGAVGVRSILQTGNTNNSPVIFTYDRFRCYSPDWHELAGATLHAEGGLQVDMAGRQTELDRTDDAVLRLVVNNVDGAYTPGALQAGRELSQGQRIRVRETIGRRSWYVFHGTLQQPEAVYGAHANDATVVVSAVDAFGEQAQGGRTFVSTLAEHIIYNGGDELAALWMLGEPSGTRFAAAGPVRREAMVLKPLGFVSLNDHTASFEAGAADPLLGDDLPRVVSTPQVNPAGNTVLYEYIPAADLSDPITLDSGEWLSFAWWAEPTSTSDLTFALFAYGASNNFIFDLRRTVAADTPVAQGLWRARIKDAGITWHLTAYGAPVKIGEAQFVSCTFTTSTVSIIVNGVQSTGTLTGSPTTPFEFNTFHVTNFTGSFSAIQVYKSSVADPMPVTKHLAQYEAGLNDTTAGLQWQRTDERFRTLCAYAGLPEPDTDYGTAWMQRAELAGKTFTEARDEAVRTEQGRAFVSGSGVPTFHSRTRTRYNL